MHPTTETTTPRTKSIWPMFVGGLVMFAFFAVAGQWLLTVGNRGLLDEETIRAKERRDILVKVKLDNADLLSGYAWIDRAKGTVRIPLDRAVELTTATLAAQGSPHPANLIDTNVALGSIVKPGGLAVPPPTPPPFAVPTNSVLPTLPPVGADAAPLPPVSASTPTEEAQP